MFGLLWAAVAYLGIRTIAGPRTDRANLYAGGGALVAALIVGIVLAASHHPAEPPVGSAVVANGQSFSCAGVLKPVARVAHGYVDNVQTLPNGAPVTPGTAIDRTATLVLRGWASDAGVHHALAGVCLLVDGKALKQQLVSYGSPRSDVAQAFKDTTLLDTGYEIRMPAADVVRGRHRLEVVGVDGSGRASAIAPPLQVTFR
jgi:hypothetical protein